MGPFYASDVSPRASRDLETGKTGTLVLAKPCNDRDERHERHERRTTNEPTLTGANSEEQLCRAASARIVSAFVARPGGLPTLAALRDSARTAAPQLVGHGLKGQSLERQKQSAALELGGRPCSMVFRRPARMGPGGVGGARGQEPRE